MLTADCIPPACIVSAKHTSTGAAFDLDPFRARYMKGSAVYAREFVAGAAVHPLFASSVTSPRHPNSCDRCELQPTIAQLEALTSVPFCGVARLRPGQPWFTPDPKRAWRHSCPLRLLALLRGKTLALKSALPAGTTMGVGAEYNKPKRGTWSELPIGRASAQANKYQPCLKPALQPTSTHAVHGLNTPLGHERHYTWKAEGRRSEASSPPRREDRDSLASNRTGTDSIEAEKVPTASEAPRPSAFKKRPRPTTAPGLGLREEAQSLHTTWRPTKSLLYATAFLRGRAAVTGQGRFCRQYSPKGQGLACMTPTHPPYQVDKMRNRSTWPQRGTGSRARRFPHARSSELVKTKAAHKFPGIAWLRPK